MGARRAELAMVLVAALALPPAAAADAETLANRCFTMSAGQRTIAPAGDGYRALRGPAEAARLFLKPTGLGSYLLYDQDERMPTLAPPGSVTRGAVAGPAAEWMVTRAPRGRFTVRSTGTGSQPLGVDPRSHDLDAAHHTRFRFTRARGCRAFPEAGLNARGQTFKGTRRDGSVIGFADPHMHVTAQFRAGGMVISGASFDRFGIAEALGHDADVHGSDGSLDVTGNLLRSGSPLGTHDTHGWPSFAGWPSFDTYTHQQVYWRWLERAWKGGLRLLGAQVVEDEPLCDIEPLRSHSCDETATIELEIRHLRALEDYIDAQHGGPGRGWFRIVRGPRQARRVIERGKLAVVIGVESSNPFGCSVRADQPQCTKDDIDRGIARLHDLGVRTIFPAHWVDNALAGAALEGGDKGTFIAAMQVTYTGAPFRTGPCPEPGQGEESPLGGARECNARGLTDLGDYALRRLMDAHMLIEADHLSEWARRRALAIAEERDYPLVSSHTGTGGLWTPGELRRLYGVGGLAVATLDDAAALPEKILALARYRSPDGSTAVGLGTDTGGFAALPGPQAGALSYPFRPYRGRVRFAQERTGARSFDLTRDGMAHYGLLPDLLAAVAGRPHGGEALDVLYRSAEAYLRMWTRAQRAR